MSCACFLPDCPQCHAGLDDGWRLDGKYVIRIHHRPRYHLFAPAGAAADGIPIPVEKLLNHRTTKIMKLGSGSSGRVSQYDEDWKDSTARDSLSFLWVGESIFEVAEEQNLAGVEGHRCAQLGDSGASVELGGAGAERHRCSQPRVELGGAGAERHRCSQPRVELGGAAAKRTAACFCFLPDCQVCSDTGNDRSNSSRNMTALGRGSSMPARGLRIIAAAHDELQIMLKQEEGWLSRGKGWHTIQTRSHHASRLEEVVARLCGCSVSLVQKARSRRKKNLFVEPKVRGRKRQRHSEHTASLEGGEVEEPGAAALWEGGVGEASLQPTLERHRVGGVQGKFLPLAVKNPEEHAIGLVLGRLMVWSFVNGIPRPAMTGLMTQLTLAGVPLGDKYQDHNAMMTFTGVIFCVLQRLMRCRLNDTIPNLPFCSAFRLIWDGITLRNGATVVPILIVFTSYAGEIVSELVDVPVSAGSTGPVTAATVCKVLDDVLSIRKPVPYVSKAGLPLHNAASQTSRPRTDALTSMLVDRAYSGATGNKADLHLCEMLGINGRLGLADKVHCCTGAASQVWMYKFTTKEKGKQIDAEAANASAPAAASGIVAEVAAPASGIIAEAVEAPEDGDSDSSSSSSSSSGQLPEQIHAAASDNVSCPRTLVRRVALCRGPGTDSVPLCSLAPRPGAAGRVRRGQTWQVSDERVGMLRGDIPTWTSLCTSLSKIFGRGVNRNFLARAYRDHKIARCPRILAPTKVRMIVYCGKFLDQSLRHHSVRVQALKLAIARLTKAKDKHSKRKLQRMQAHTRVLLSPTLHLPLLVNDLIHIRHGYQSGCVLLQQTKAVFFQIAFACSANVVAVHVAGRAAVGAARVAS